MKRSRTKERKSIHADMLKARKLIDRVARAFGAECRRSKDKGARSSACRILKNLGSAAGTLETDRDFVKDIFR